MTRFTLALYQNDSEPLNKDAQLKALAKAAQSAAMANAKLLITPELYMSGYKIPDAVEGVAEPQDGAFLEQAGAIARDNGIALLIGYPEQSDEGVYNSAALKDDTGKLVLNHRKLHLSGPYEKAHFITDNNDVQLAEIGGIKVCLLYTSDAADD